MRKPGKVNLLGNVGNVGNVGNLGKSRICWLTWCVVVGSSQVTTVQGGDDDCTAFVAVLCTFVR